MTTAVESGATRGMGLPMGLDQAAVEAVQKWRFKPAELNGRPVQVYYPLTVSFQVPRSP